MTLVVDASVAVKWFVEEDGTAAAEALVTAGGQLIAPDFLVTEVGNALWRKVLNGEVTRDDAITAIDTLRQSVTVMVPISELTRRALEIAIELRHPIYDCLYLALAELRATTLVTSDRRLLRVVGGGEWESRVQALEV